jgi:beta-phosphoglucomutase
MSHRNGRAVLWDLDGTLVDSGDYHWRAWKSTLEREGVPLTYQQFLASFGQRNDRILQDWLGEGASVKQVRRIGDAKEREYRRLAQEEGLEPLPGASEWVTRLHAAGWRQAVASSAPRANLDVMLGVLNLSLCFEATVAAEDVTTGKPDPDVFLAAAFRLHVPPSRCIVVEDAAAGIEAARRAKMRSIGVSGTASLEADLFVKSLADLAPDAFDSLLPAVRAPQGGS